MNILDQFILRVHNWFKGPPHYLEQGPERFTPDRKSKGVIKVLWRPWQDTTTIYCPSCDYTENISHFNRPDSYNNYQWQCLKCKNKFDIIGG